MENFIVIPKESISLARLVVLRGALKLEIAGLHGRGQSAYKRLKNDGFTGSRSKVLHQVEQIIGDLKAVQA